MRAMITLEDCDDGKLFVDARLFATDDELKRGMTETETPASQLFSYLEHAIEKWKAQNGLASLRVNLEPNDQTLKH